MAEAETLVAEEIAHSPLGASGSERWMACPGSIQLAKRLGITDNAAGAAAEQGTAAHEVLERCLAKDSGVEPLDFMGQKILVGENEYIVDANMVDALNIACNHVWETLAEVKEEGGEVRLYIEESMKHSDHDLMYGTVDVGIVVIYPNRRKVKIKIKDYKHGLGVVVEPYKPQIKYYATLIGNRLMEEFIIDSFDDIEDIELTIMQPRIPHPDGLIRSIHMTGPELWAWYTEELVPAMEATTDPDAIIQLGDHCMFCPAKAQCPAIGEATVSLMTALPPEQQTGEELGRNIEKIKAISKLLEPYKEAAFKKALGGERVFGHKLVDQTGNRVWNSDAEKAAAKLFGEEAYDKSLKSPAQMEKVAGGKVFCAKHAYKPQKGLTLAPLSDKRAEQKTLMDRLIEQESQAF